MSLLLQSPLAETDPQLHAFIVGVGEYPHLENGSLDTAIDTSGLQQLTAPPISAKAIATWLVENKSTLSVPLGTVELLVSEHTPTAYVLPDGKKVDIDVATYKTVKERFADWRKRCNANEKNIAFFYFCGHGIQKTDLYLLFSDFGEDQDDLFANSVNFDLTYKSMNRCKANTQLYFVDSCRQLTRSALNRQLSVGGFGDVTVKADAPKDAPKVFATAESTTAYAMADQVTDFAQSIMACLSGTAAESKGANWTVTTESLVRVIRKVATKRMLERNLTQQCTSDGNRTNGDQELVKLAAPPSVDIFFQSDPDGLLGTSKVSLKLIPASQADFELDSATTPYTIRVPADLYYFDALLPAPHPSPPTVRIWIQPPFVETEIKSDGTTASIGVL